ncbi:MAG: stage II sporulation protein M [Candidatus Woesearchaeota archaeon]
MLESIFNLKWVEKSHHAVFLGFMYAILGILIAGILFPHDVGIMSVVFTTILLTHTIHIIIRDKEHHLRKNITPFLLWLFGGVFIANFLIGLNLSQSELFELFRQQLVASGIVSKSATYFHTASFYTILTSNIRVLLVCFLISILFGAGGAIILAWNASVWGVAMSFLLRTQGLFVIGIIPHLMLEALAYVFATIAGNLISEAYITDKRNMHKVSKKAIQYLAIGLILLVIGSGLEVFYAIMTYPF